MARRHHLVEPYDLLGRARLDEVDGLPVWANLTRGPGSWSRQTAPAVDGQTFIELGTSEDTPRWDYDPASGRLMLLIEPTRTNVVGPSLLTDVATADELPDGWAATAGAAGVDFETTVAGSPTGGPKFRLLDTATANRGALWITALAATTQYAMSVWVRRTAAGAANLIGIETNPGVYANLPLSALAHDWARAVDLATTVGAGGDILLLAALADPAGIVELAAPQVEAGDCATSPILGDVAATRAAELLTIDPSVVGRTSGFVSFLWRPDYASTAALTVNPCLFAFAAGYELIYDVADDKVKIVVGGVNQAASAALTFARQSLHRISLRYGSGGTQLTVDGLTYEDTTTWGDPGALAPYLGSRAASVNCRPAAYGDLVLAA